MADTKMSALPVAGALGGADIFAIAQGGVSKQASVTQVQTAVTAGFVPTSRLINTTSPLAGGGDLSADRTLTIADAVADAVTKGAATFTASDFNSAAGVISIDYTNGQAASAVNKGFLTSADWSTFNGKQDALPVVDTTAIVKGSTDATKLLRFEVDGFTAGTTRVLTPPNQNCTIAGLEVAQTFSASQTFTPANNIIPVVIAAGSVTGAGTANFLNIAGTWNTTGAPDAIQLVVTDTASDPASNLLDLMIGATSQFAVSKAGSVTQLGQLRITGAAALTSLIHASTNTTATGLTIFEQASADTDDYDLSFRKARGTVAVPTVITVGDFLGNIIFRGYSGAGGYVTTASIRAVSTGTIASTRIPSSLVFSTGTDAAPTVLTTALTINNVQQLLVTNGTAALPSIAFSSSATSGLLLNGSTVAISAGGTIHFGVAAAGARIDVNDSYAWASVPGTGSPDLSIFRDGADTLAQRRTTSAQTSRWYETFTDASNYSRSTLTTQAGNHLIRTEAAGTGTLRILQVGTGPSTGTDIAGVSTIIHGGQSTGTGVRGAILFQQSAPAGGTGSGVNALSTTWSIATDGTFTAADAFNIAFGTGTGTKIGTATTQKIAFWNKAPIIQPTNAIAASAFVANTSGIVNDTATFGGYTIGQIAAALIATGILT